MTNDDRNPKSECQIGAGPCGPLIRILKLFRHSQVVIRISIRSQFHLDIIPFDHHSKALHAFKRRRREHIACFQVERRVVPGTYHFVAVHLAFGQWPARVRAGVLDCVKCAAHVEHRDAIAIDLGRRGGAWREVFRIRHFHQSGHKLINGVMEWWHPHHSITPTLHYSTTPSPRYISPNCRRAASVIMPWFHGGSQTNSTFASSISSTANSLFCTSCASTGPIPQPGAVNVIFTSALKVLPSPTGVS